MVLVGPGTKLHGEYLDSSWKPTSDAFKSGEWQRTLSICCKGSQDYEWNLITISMIRFPFTAWCLFCIFLDD